MGLIVDCVEEVVTLTSDVIEPTPDFGARLSTEYILGMAKVKGQVKTLLDLDRVVAAATGQRLWQWQAPPRNVPGTIDGFSIGLSTIPHQIGVCSSAAIDGDRVYFVSNRCDLLCLDVAGQPPGPAAGRRAGRS